MALARPQKVKPWQTDPQPELWPTGDVAPVAADLRLRIGPVDQQCTALCIRGSKCTSLVPNRFVMAEDSEVFQVPPR